MSNQYNLDNNSFTKFYKRFIDETQANIYK